MRAVSEFERAVVRAMLTPSFPEMTEPEVDFVAIRWRNLPGIFPVDVEIEPEIEWLLSRYPLNRNRIEEEDRLKRLLARSRARLAAMSR